jgi:hypothetical protein
MLGIHHDSVMRTLRDDLNISKVNFKWMPHVLNSSHKRWHASPKHYEGPWRDMSFAAEVPPVDLVAFLLYAIMGLVKRRKFQSKLFAQLDVLLQIDRSRPEFSIVDLRPAAGNSDE